jgi:hypothetical protein
MRRLINKIKIKPFSNEDSRIIINNAISNDNIAFIFNDKGKKYSWHTFINTFDIEYECEAIGYLDNDSGGYCCEDLSVENIIEYTTGNHAHQLVISIFLPILMKEVK